jgi:hypothetical protein
MKPEIVTLYDELNRAYECEVIGTRVIRVISAPELEPEARSYTCLLTETDTRFGE